MFKVLIFICFILVVFFFKVGGSWNVDDFVLYEYGFLIIFILILDMWKLKYDMNF